MAARFFMVLAALLPCVGLIGCRTAPPLPAADTSSPGWQVKQGQAVWTPERKRPEMTGELFLAQHAGGDCLVQFAKPPFSIVEARVIGQCWQLDFGSGRRVWRGKGKPPAKIMWFQLARAQSGAELDQGWSCAREPDGAWILSNPRTGERLEGRFFE